MLILRRLLIIAVVLVAWEAIVAMRLIPPIILASPTSIVLAGFAGWREFFDAALITAAEIIVSFVIAVTLGVATGSLVGRSFYLARPTAAILSSLFAVPLVIIYPLFMAWFGIGPTSKIVFGVLMGYFPIAINTLNGINSVEQRYITLCRSIGATRLQTYLRVLIPKALPSIVTGLRVGSGLVVIGVIVAEMLASRSGIGFMITHYRSIFETGYVYFGIIIALVFAYVANRGISAAECYAFGGHSRTRGKAPATPRAAVAD